MWCYIADWKLAWFQTLMSGSCSALVLWGVKRQVCNAPPTQGRVEFQYTHALRPCSIYTALAVKYRAVDGFLRNWGDLLSPCPASQVGCSTPLEIQVKNKRSIHQDERWELPHDEGRLIRHTPHDRKPGSMICSLMFPSKLIKCRWPCCLLFLHLILSSSVSSWFSSPDSSNGRNYNAPLIICNHGRLQQSSTGLATLELEKQKCLWPILSKPRKSKYKLFIIKKDQAYHLHLQSTNILYLLIILQNIISHYQ